ncbi:hypothetical protein [Streptosporangium sp. H16]|uniref:hypothetical protein n=1 Tax=Streptosporangium sp. H16 TaxID=3444184 RepID=UPI003F78F35B
MPYQPNRTATQIIKQLKGAGFTVSVPDEPSRARYTLTFYRSVHFGTMDVSAAKGRALRLSMTNQLNGRTKTAEGAVKIRKLLNDLPQES